MCIFAYNYTLVYCEDKGNRKEQVPVLESLS